MQTFMPLRLMFKGALITITLVACSK